MIFLSFIKFIMSDLPLTTFRFRSKSAIPRNFTNIDLHACLDEAKLYKV